MSQEPRRVAITGAGGRLGTALLRTAPGRTDRDVDRIGWRRADLDLDAPQDIVSLLRRDRPDLVIHAAAWTDVDGCARDPALARARNGDATGVVAAACAAAGCDLVVVSSNEVFDGARSDGRAYLETDAVAPRNPYGTSKLHGEMAARAAFGDTPGLWIVRVGWLYGPPSPDFPHKIVQAADRLPPGQALTVVADEYGTPTATDDLADAILALVGRSPGGTFHLAPAGSTSRYGWAKAVLDRVRPDRSMAPVSRSSFVRASDPPPWGVLDAGRAATLGVALPDWRASLDRYLAAWS